MTSSTPTPSNQVMLNDVEQTVAVDADEADAGGLCGAIPKVDINMNMKGRITDLKQKGRGVISKLQRSSTSFSSEGAAASLYDPSLYLCGGDGNVELDQEIILESEPIPASVIGDPDRTVCVITTAALPWRTGTAVNPLLRALYLVRFQNEQREKLKKEENSTNFNLVEKLILEREENNELLATIHDNDNEEEGEVNSDYNNMNTEKEENGDDNAGNENDNNENENENDNNNKGGGSVVLVIPWLESKEDRKKLYGENNSFSNGPRGIQEQEAWIRKYSSERCGMPSEATQLKMIFYPAFYLAGFGSIFPKVDLCNFIPRELVDVAILEEPEHLNWFRMPNSREKSMRDIGDDGDGGSTSDCDDGEDLEETIIDEESSTSKLSLGGESGVFDQKVELTINESPTNDLADIVELPDITNENNDVNAILNHANPSDNDQSQQQLPSSKKKYIEKAKLGWTHRFRFVVGIVHTNYEAYARQYGIGASLIAAPAIGAVSALTIRAHCHQVIKLSDTLPDFAPGKELTCNVHGVRREFLEGVDLDVLASTAGTKDGDGGTKQQKLGNDKDDAEAPSPVYFIGKLVWAKGFDVMLELQNIFRKRNGKYFHIDVYGGGPDEKAIARAFHGRHHSSPTKRPPPPTSTDISPDSSSHPSGPKGLNINAILTNPQSIKDQSSQVIEQMQQRHSLRADGDGDDVVGQYLSLGFEVSQMNGNATYVKESRRGLDGKEEEGKDYHPQASSLALSSSSSNKKNPLDILGDLSEKSFDTGVKTSQAVYNIADSSIKNILTMSFSQLKHPLKSRFKKKEESAKQKQPAQDLNKKVGTNHAKEDEKGDAEGKPKFVFDPPASRYEWRRHPIPAKFPGVVDHVQLKNLPHKIFLNPSTSEVLCTTTAEALAMNKFVIIPKHPSNDFFMQFTNCLSYESLEECADKMAWALGHTPTTLSDEERRKFTWEAATERLMNSSIVTVKQARERAENGMDKTDARIAFWLSESGEKSNMIRNLFHKNGNGGGGGGGHSLPLVGG